MTAIDEHKSDEEIAKVKALLPETKIIIGLRDPIEREWSRARLAFINKGPVPDDKYYQLFEQEHTHKSNDYAALVSRWKKHFGEQNVCLFFYDELKEDPQKVLSKISVFLGVETLSFKDTKHKVNAAPEHEIPEHFLLRLLALNSDYLKQMASYFDQAYPQQWLKKYEKRSSSKVS